MLEWGAVPVTVNANSTSSGNTLTFSTAFTNDVFKVFCICDNSGLTPATYLYTEVNFSYSVKSSNNSKTTNASMHYLAIGY